MFLSGAIVVLMVVVMLIIAFQLYRIGTRVTQAVNLLDSLDKQLFWLAIEQIPNYGRCTNCGRRDIVRHVVPREGEPDPNEPDMFYCSRCYWLSGSVRMGDDSKSYKTRTTEEDIRVSKIGPG